MRHAVEIFWGRSWPRPANESVARFVPEIPGELEMRSFFFWCYLYPKATQCQLKSDAHGLCSSFALGAGSGTLIRS